MSSAGNLDADVQVDQTALQALPSKTAKHAAEHIWGRRTCPRRGSAPSYPRAMARVHIGEMLEVAGWLDQDATAWMSGPVPEWPCARS